MKGLNGLWLALALLLVMFSAADCSSKHSVDSIAQAIVKHLEAK